MSWAKLLAWKTVTPLPNRARTVASVRLMSPFPEENSTQGLTCSLQDICFNAFHVGARYAAAITYQNLARPLVVAREPTALRVAPS